MENSELTALSGKIGGAPVGQAVLTGCLSAAPQRFVTVQTAFAPSPASKYRSAPYSSRMRQKQGALTLSCVVCEISVWSKFHFSPVSFQTKANASDELRRGAPADPTPAERRALYKRQPSMLRLRASSLTYHSELRSTGRCCRRWPDSKIQHLGK